MHGTASLKLTARLGAPVFRRRLANILRSLGHRCRVRTLHPRTMGRVMQFARETGLATVALRTPLQASFGRVLELHTQARTHASAPKTRYWDGDGCRGTQ